MKLDEFQAGHFENGYKYKYFVPSFICHSFSWDDPSINQLLEKASLKLGELNSFSRFVPDIGMFIRMHVLKEAIVSSRIEGTRTNFNEMLAEEAFIDPERRDDRLEVSNYVKAMDFAINKLKTLPISCRLIRNVHAQLLSSGRGAWKTPGEFRTSQNWIGGASIADASFIPPAAEKLPELLSDFERFLNDDQIFVPNLIKIAIAHYQFETIHPFLDGNGRMGRLLITLFLVSNNILEKPLLYLSTFFEKHRSIYYDNLMRAREKNDLAQWIRFFLVGVAETAESAIDTLQKIIELKERVEQTIRIYLARRADVGHTLLKALFSTPQISIKGVEEVTKLSTKAANSLVQLFVDNGILTEISEQRRNRVYAFSEYVKLFETE